MASTYTIQVSNHPDAGQRIPAAAAADSWKILYDGPIESDRAARITADKLADWYRNVRVFKGEGALGRFWYGVLRMGNQTDRRYGQ